MASPSRTLKLTYLGDASQLKKTNDEVEKGFGKVGDGIKKFGKIAAAGFAAGGAAAIVVAKKLFNAAENAETANARIEQITTSMGNFGDEASQVAAEIASTASELAKLTGVERNTIKETQALLLTFDSVNKTADQTGGVFERATKAAVDLAAAGFGTATGNAAQLGKALEDPIRGLSSLTRSGVTFTEAERERIKTLVKSNQVGEAQAIILEAIEKQVGGTAEATSTASDRIKQSFAVITDEIALALVPQFEKLTDAVARLIDRFAEWWKENGPRVIEVIGNTVDKAKALWDIIRTNLEPIVRTLIETLVDLIARFRDWWQQVAPAVFDAFGRIKDAVVSVWDAIKPLITTVIDIWKAMFGGIKSGGEGNLFLSFLEGITRVIEIVAGVIRFLVNRITDLYNILLRIAQSRPIQAVLGAIGKIGGAIGGAVSRVGGIIGLAEGGIVTRPTLAMVGEGGEPEAVIPLSKMGQMGGGTTIVINGAIDPEGTARQIRRILDDSTRRVGPSQSAVFA
jgi:phage-related protein